MLVTIKVCVCTYARFRYRKADFRKYLALSDRAAYDIDQFYLGPLAVVKFPVNADGRYAGHSNRFTVMCEEPNSGSKVLSEVPEAYNALEVLLQIRN